MAGHGEGEGKGSEKLTDNIACVKYTVFCFNIVAWVSHLIYNLIKSFSWKFFNYDKIQIEGKFIYIAWFWYFGYCTL